MSAWFIHGMTMPAAFSLSSCVVFYGTNRQNVFILSPVVDLLQFRTMLNKAAGIL